MAMRNLNAGSSATVPRALRCADTGRNALRQYAAHARGAERAQRACMQVLHPHAPKHTLVPLRESGLDAPGCLRLYRGLCLAFCTS